MIWLKTTDCINWSSFISISKTILSTEARYLWLTSFSQIYHSNSSRVSLFHKQSWLSSHNKEEAISFSSMLSINYFAQLCGTDTRNHISIAKRVYGRIKLPLIIFFLLSTAKIAVTVKFFLKKKPLNLNKWFGSWLKIRMELHGSHLCFSSSRFNMEQVNLIWVLCHKI